MTKTMLWRVTVSKIEEVRGLHHEVLGFAINGVDQTTYRWYFKGTSRKDTDFLGFAGKPGPWEAASKFKIPKYVVASVQGLARTMIAADKRKVQLPIDFFDPCGAKGQRDEAHCSPESE